MTADDRGQVCGPTYGVGILAGGFVSILIITTIDANLAEVLPPFRQAFGVFVITLIAALFLAPVRRTDTEEDSS